MLKLFVNTRLPNKKSMHVSAFWSDWRSRNNNIVWISLQVFGVETMDNWIWSDHFLIYCCNSVNHFITELYFRICCELKLINYQSQIIVFKVNSLAKCRQCFCHIYELLKVFHVSVITKVTKFLSVIFIRVEFKKWLRIFIHFFQQSCLHLKLLVS